MNSMNFFQCAKFLQMLTSYFCALNDFSGVKGATNPQFTVLLNFNLLLFCEHG